jgi:hypothetical protein
MKQRLLILAAMAGLCVAQDEGPAAYRDVSAGYKLGDADRLMTSGKYVEAAVLYRSALLEGADRDAVRIPFAMALLANGDAEYAGIELRRAVKFYDGFARLRPAAEELFESRETLHQIAKKAAETAEGDALLAVAYARIVLGDRRAAHDAINKYSSARNEPDVVRTLRAMADDETPRAAKPAKESAEIDGLRRRVQQLPAAARTGPPVAPGTPARAPMIVAEPRIPMQEEVFEK